MSNKNQKIDSEARKRLKQGSYSSVITVVVVAVLIVLNLIMSGLPSSWTKFDFSEQQILVLSDQTEEILENLDTEITIYVVTQAGNEDTYITELVDKYGALSSKITVKTIDTALNPTFTQNYDISGEVEDNSLIVESENRFQYIAYEDIYETTYTNYSDGTYESSTSFDGENQLTSAIDYVSSTESITAYTMTGHSETDLPEDLTSEIETENITVESLNLIQTGEIPEDCKMIIFYAPTEDITSDELTLLEEYIDDGGSILLVDTLSKENMPNMEKLLAQYGIEIEEGMVLEGDSNYTYSGYSNYVFAQLSSHTITDPLIESGMNVMIVYGEAITYTEPADGTVTGTALLTTTSSGYVKALDATTTEVEEGDMTGTLNLGYAIEKTVDSDDESTGKIIVYSTPLIFDESVNELTAGGNYDLVINSVGWLCDHTSSISIHSKSLSSTSLTVSTASANLWSTLLVAVIPILLIAVGVVVWIVRRMK